MISKLVETVIQVMAILLACVQAVERPGDGELKKAEAVAAAKALIQALEIPAMVKTIFSQDIILGILIELLVSVMNKTGWFKTSAPAPAPNP